LGGGNLSKQVTCAPSLEQSRADLVARLMAQRGEIEAAIFARVRETVADPVVDEDAELVAGLREVIVAAVESSLVSIERGQPWSGPVPQVVLAQARRAVRSGVSLNTILRRYVVGYARLWDYVMETADDSDFSNQQQVMLLRQASMAQTSLLDRLIDAIAEEYVQETRRVTQSSAQRRAELVQELLAGQVVDTTQLGYDLDAVHLGVIATGAGAEDTVRHLARELDRRLLSVARSEQTVWAWIGARQPPPAAQLERLLRGGAFADVSLAVGEPAAGLEGFRATHRQAQAALRVAQRQRRPVTRYADIALIAVVLSDESVARSLIDIYLSPFGGRGDEDAKLRETLRAYFAAGHNASAAAAALEVNRRTIEYRVRDYERRLGCPLRDRQVELEVALRLAELLEAPERGP
jgi:sugar diacid utilization regulator